MLISVIILLQHLTRLCSVVTSCVSAFSIDLWLQTNMYQCGVLWHLLQYLFQYDYTLEEGGVAKSDDSNQQVIFVLFVSFLVNVCTKTYISLYLIECLCGPRSVYTVAVK